ncbi:ribonuclease Z [Arenibaculum pallidiluteum]|uniref:ribonuclease Z n=1 Tax=Arenibaculum pallidiluteum TaxID=2812559 RepID=UPI001A9569BE|nr:MBL fold metallo-hydrolase [Arenibaculum pallidiluteum]
MARFFRARLVDGPAGDPAVFVDFRFAGRALLLDAGDLAPLSGRELGRVGDLLLSHAHMDHFADFDRLLRACLHRPRRLRIVGPAGLIDRVGSRLASYSWNLLGPHSADFSLLVLEFAGDGLRRAASFAARDAFRRSEAALPVLPPGVVLDEEEFSVEAAELDHGIPCLGFALREKMRVNVWREGLAALGLSVGPWLNAAKRALRQGASDDTVLPVGGGAAVSLGMLRGRALHPAPGQSLGYLTDMAGTAANIGRAAALMRGVDQLFIEAMFLDIDAALAAERRHLTARQAGRIAAMAGAGRIVPFHFSARYHADFGALVREAETAFAEAGPHGARAAPVPGS